VAKVGRPSTYNETLANKICEYRASGLSIRKIAEKPGMPGTYTIMRWRGAYPEFAQRYESAWKQAIESDMDSLVDLADEANSKNHNAVRLRVDTRKWVASKILHNLYGDRIEHDVSGRVTLVMEQLAKPKGAGTIDSDRDED